MALFSHDSLLGLRNLNHLGGGDEFLQPIGVVSSKTEFLEDVAADAVSVLETLLVLVSQMLRDRVVEVVEVVAAIIRTQLRWVVPDVSHALADFLTRNALVRSRDVLQDLKTLLLLNLNPSQLGEHIGAAQRAAEKAAAPVAKAAQRAAEKATSKMEDRAAALVHDKVAPAVLEFLVEVYAKHIAGASLDDIATTTDTDRIVVFSTLLSAMRKGCAFYFKLLCIPEHLTLFFDDHVMLNGALPKANDFVEYAKIDDERSCKLMLIALTVKLAREREQQQC